MTDDYYILDGDYWEEKQKNTMDLIEKDYQEFVSRKQRTQIEATESNPIIA